MPKKSQAPSDIYLGIMSGTSMDAVDVVAVDFSISPFTLLGTYSEPLPSTLSSSLHELCQPGHNEINRLGQLDKEVGFLFAKACNTLLAKITLNKKDIIAIGSHGQTIRHQPSYPMPFTLQIGDPNVIAEITGITTIADFRRRDMVCGGQGAPLTPAFHHFAFYSDTFPRAIVNIGGISNITLLPTNPCHPVKGYDCGPGNTLLDGWARRHLNQPFDSKGAWAAQGTVNSVLLEQLLSDPYFDLPPPKSTGREYFNIEWLTEKLAGKSLCPQDVQSTLSELTACCIMRAVEGSLSGKKEILLCGGGTQNTDLVTRIYHQRGDNALFSTLDFGVDPLWVEAIAFAWLARQTMHRLPGNLPEVTGATMKTILGGIYPAS